LQRLVGEAIPVPVALIPDRDIPPAEAKALVGERKTENELKPEDIAARLKTLTRDIGDPVDAFIADNWTLEFDLALQPELAQSVYRAVRLAKTSSRKPAFLAKLVESADKTYAGWVEAGLSATEIAVKIYQPVHDKEASKAEVAEQLAAILRQRTDTAEQMRERLPGYLVRAIDYVTGGYVPGAPAFPADPADAEEEGDEDCEVGVAGEEAAGA
jgi:putative ATP-dependent endonuclease of OLD family